MVLLRKKVYEKGESLGPHLEELQHFEDGCSPSRVTLHRGCMNLTFLQQS